MNILIKYNEDNKKVLIKIEEEEFKELDFTVLLSLSNLVIEEKTDLNLTTEGFDNLADIEENYKNIFNQISDLKNNIEIKELKDKMEDNKVASEGEEEDEDASNSDNSIVEVQQSDDETDPFADIY